MESSKTKFFPINYTTKNIFVKSLSTSIEYGIFLEYNDITKLNSKKIAKFRREELGFIFQDFNLLDTLTCYENIALALTISRVNHKEIEMRVKEISSKLGIIEILNK